jgi:hypothetical protein
MGNPKGDPMDVGASRASLRKRKSDLAEGAGDSGSVPKAKGKKSEKNKEPFHRSASTSQEELSPDAASILSESQEVASRITLAIKRAVGILTRDPRVPRATINEASTELQRAITESWVMAIDLEAHKAIVKDRASLTRAIAQAPIAPPRSLWSDIARRDAQPSRAPTAWPSVPPKTAARPGVMFFPTKEGQESSTTKEVVKKAISPEALGVHVTGVRMIRGGGVIVHPKSAEEAKRLVEAPGLTQAGLRAQVAARKIPRVIIFNTPSSTTEGELRQAIVDNTGDSLSLTESEKNEIKISHKAGPRGEKCHMVLYVPGKVHEALLKESRLFHGWESFPVRDFCGVLKCAKCHLYGHMAKHCSAKAATCGHCAAEGHDRADCPGLEAPPKCPACTRFKKPSQHAANDPECPARLHAVALERSRTDYSPQ